MLSQNSLRIITTLAVSLVVFIIAVILPKLFLTSSVPKVLTTQGLELVLSLLAVMLLGKSRFADYGFRMPRPKDSTLAALGRWSLVALGALTIGAVSSMAMLITGAGGNPLIKQLSFPQIILLVWISSSTIEEIFTRGFLQSHLASAFDSTIKIPVLRVDLPTFISALFFGAMHLVLILTGADAKTVVIIVLFTFSLGLLAGHQRAKSGSLVPAIGVHMLGNIGGVVGGIIYMIYAMLTGGKMPGA